MPLSFLIPRSKCSKTFPSARRNPGKVQQFSFGLLFVFRCLVHVLEYRFRAIRRLESDCRGFRVDFLSLFPGRLPEQRFPADPQLFLLVPLLLAQARPVADAEGQNSHPQLPRSCRMTASLLLAIRLRARHVAANHLMFASLNPTAISGGNGICCSVGRQRCRQYG